MGVALGAGLIIGIRAATGAGLPIALLLVAGLIAIACVAPNKGRMLALGVACGVSVGFLIGVVREVEPLPAYTGLARGTLVVTATDDPEITSRGFSVAVAWTDPEGSRRSSTLFFPTGTQFPRGSTADVTATIRGMDAETLVASTLSPLTQPTWPETWRQRGRAWISNHLLSSVAGSEGSLTLGLLIGDDSGLTGEDNLAVRAAGLSHITAVSGWNVTLVTSTLATIFSALGLQNRRWMLVQISAVAGFVWIVGPDPPVLRAGVMAAAVLAAHVVGRPAHAVSMVTLTAALLVALNPGILGSLSFQLSILATAALVIGLVHLPDLRGWRAVIVLPAITTVLVGVATAPVLAASTGTLSVAAIPANVLAAPLVELTTAAGILVLIAGSIGPLQHIAGIVTWLLAHLILGVAHLGDWTPWGHWQFAALSPGGAAALHMLVLTIAVAALPETRLSCWEMAQWVQHQPRTATLVASGLLATMLTTLVIILP